MRPFIAAVCAIALATPHLQADGLIYRLPEDGTSVRYALELKLGREGMEKSAGGYLAVSSVGKETVNNEPCRWIEFKMLFDIDGKERIIVAKMLIPEKALKRGENAAAFMVRGWVSERGTPEAAKELKDLQNARAGPLPAFLAGPAADAKKLPAEVLETKLGKLECEGVAGSHTFDQGQEKVEYKHHTRLHDKAPFGVVQTRMEFKVERNGMAAESGVMSLQVLEVTQGAKSELPDHK
jgi:hypothetical protein